MASFTASQTIDMRTFFIDTDADPELDYLTSSTTLTIVKPSSTFIARGTGFTFDNEGGITGGTVQSMEESRNGSPAWELTGLSFSLAAIEDFYDANDAFDMAGFNAAIFAGADSIVGSSGSDWLGGFGGVDTIRGGSGNDTLDGGSGGDRLAGGAGSDTYIVNTSTDVITESSTGGTTDVVLSSAASYTLSPYLERLTLQGTAGISGTGNAQANLITGNSGANRIDGAGGADRISAGAGNDTLFGGIGDDSINGGGGNDSLVGGAGNDTLVGGSGLDAYLFNAALSAASNVDRIGGFVAADDTIRLENAIFTRLTTTGTLASTAFVQGTAAQDSGDRIVYDSTTGQLWYDSDGNGAAAKVLFATVTAGTLLTNADFVIV